MTFRHLIEEHYLHIQQLREVLRRVRKDNARSNESQAAFEQVETAIQHAQRSYKDFEVTTLLQHTLDAAQECGLSPVQLDYVLQHLLAMETRWRLTVERACDGPNRVHPTWVEVAKSSEMLMGPKWREFVRKIHTLIHHQREVIWRSEQLTYRPARFSIESFRYSIIARWNFYPSAINFQVYMWCIKKKKMRLYVEDGDEKCTRRVAEMLIGYRYT